MSGDASPQPPSISRSQWIVLCAILVLAAALRSHGLARQSLWLDEIWSIELATGRPSPQWDLPKDTILRPAPDFTHFDGAPSVWHVWPASATNASPPLYYLLLRGWMRAFGESDAAVRMLSVIASVLAVLAIFDVGRLLFSGSAGLWSAALMTVAVPQIQYAQECRPYALLLAVGLGCCSLLLRIERVGSTIRRCALLALGLWAMFALHYLAAGAIAALWIYAVVRVRGKDRWLVQAAFGASALLVAGTLLPLIVRQAHGFALEMQTIWLREDPDGRLLRGFGRLALIPGRLLTERYAPPWSWRVGLLVLLVPPLLFRRQPSLVLPWLWAVMSAGLVAALDYAHSTCQLQYIRYTLLAGPGIYLLIAGLLSSASRWERHLLPVAATIACVLALPDAFGVTTTNWRGLGRTLHELAGADDVVVFMAVPRDVTVGVPYLCTMHYAAPLPAAMLWGEKPDESAAAQLAQARSVWVISPTIGRVKQLLPSWQIAEQRPVPGAPILLRVTPPPSTSASTAP